MPENVTLEHIRDIVNGACGALGARLGGLEQQVEGGFKSTHARISDQARHLHELAGEVARTNGKVLGLRSDVDRIAKDMDTLGREVHQERDRSTREASEMRNFLHKRASDRDDAPAVEHERAADRQKSLIESLIEKTAVRYVGALGAGAAGLKFIEWFVREVVK